MEEAVWVKRDKACGPPWDIRGGMVGDSAKRSNLDAQPREAGAEEEAQEGKPEGGAGCCSGSEREMKKPRWDFVRDL